MSVLFGRWNFSGSPVDAKLLDNVRAVAVAYGPDGHARYEKDGIALEYCAFNTLETLQTSNQPHRSPAGTIFTWDGRLDNRLDLIRELDGVVGSDVADVEIVAAAFERWGTNCLRRLLGDWALVVWNPTTRTLILAKDMVGIRPLYYSTANYGVSWSTILELLVRSSGTPLALCEEYVAGWLSFFPATHLTPYIGLSSVSPGTYVLLRANVKNVTKFWDFDGCKRIRYKSDSEYEEHFRTVFAESVQRRVHSCRPVLAELSGGMDSSSIVCVADALREKALSNAPALETVSYFNDLEPNWNELPYFTRVEKRRGRTGIHIDISSIASLGCDGQDKRFPSTPDVGHRQDKPSQEFADYLSTKGIRVVLSGIGGDEVTGGVPTPTPEITDLIASLRLGHLGHQLKVWAINKRQPWLHLFLTALRGFFSPVLAGRSKRLQPPPWFRHEFVSRNRLAFDGYETRLKFFGSPPHFQQCLSTLAALQRQLSSEAPPTNPYYEKRYPFLDRDLLEFLFALPPEQLVRPGQRRSLMRRALVGIVPDEILNRKRKAFVARAPLAAVSAHWEKLASLNRDLISDSVGFVDKEVLWNALQSARDGKELPIVLLMRTLAVEGWLRALHRRKIVDLFPMVRQESRVAVPGKAKVLIDRKEFSPIGLSVSQNKENNDEVRKT